MTKLEEQIKEALHNHSFLTHTAGQQAEAISKIALKLAEKAYYQGGRDYMNAIEDTWADPSFKKFIKNYL